MKWPWLNSKLTANQPTSITTYEMLCLSSRALFKCNTINLGLEVLRRRVTRMFSPILKLRWACLSRNKPWEAVVQERVFPSSSLYLKWVQSETSVQSRTACMHWVTRTSIRPHNRFRVTSSSTPRSFLSASRRNWMSLSSWLHTIS